MGIVQSFGKLLAWRPDVVFTKGGFVCLPVGIAAKLLGIPLVIHDSDAHPGLTNRILARWAVAIGTGAPLEFYSYPSSRSFYVGIPVREEFRPRTQDEKRQIRKSLGLSEDTPLVVVTGGGLGAKRINDTLATIGAELIKEASVVHIAGTLQYDELRDRVPQDARYKLLSFVDNEMADILGAADLVVTRAGATTMLELAALAAPTIIIPNGQLTGGHQLKNAQVYANAEAAIVLEEEATVKDPRVLLTTIQGVLRDTAASRQLSEKIHTFAMPSAAHDVADMIVRVGQV